MNMKKNLAPALEFDKVYESEILSVNNFGNGACRIGPAVVFVPTAVTGDRIRLKIVKSEPNYYMGEIVGFTKKSPHRIQSDCGLFSDGRCGGCDFRNISYSHELEIKKSFVESAMKRNGFSGVKINEVASAYAGGENGYRSKIIVRADGLGYGYYTKSTHDIAYQKKCALHPENLDKIISRTHSMLRHLDFLRGIYIREGRGKSGGAREIMLCVIINSGGFEDEKEFSQKIAQEFPDIKGIFINVNRDEKKFALGSHFRKIYGSDYIEDSLCGLTFRISPQSFYQINHAGAEILYNLAADAVLSGPGGDMKKVADLYCGTGTIGMCIAKRSRGEVDVTGVDTVKSSIDDAVSSAKLNKIDNIKFICGDAKDFGEKTDAAVIDPPRKGCSGDAVNTLIRLSPKRIVYVSCNPETMARDAKKLCESGGYEVKYISPADMFPRTPHVECVMLMSRVGK